MSKYAKLDEAILKKMGGHAKAFSSVLVRDVREECERIAKLESAEQKREIESLRVLDRRLQALRKAGAIWHNGKGWLRES
ncbi:hypothetical protein ACI2TD_18085 [Ralstonia nicotianae]